ncbi:hypothetical protein TRFO_11531 [Tritrichomonas foetus]|uniref:DUSP domain-containing protein n=1 Tax=Tritrichomonas foetus TaxID=1144522 RepID=A0A1J4J326_9EUKA|nr:hypothetical protein TRFO_11531 [Tritrichomonas foetus]|eukprot:OHS93754.1 hypothetical protein TRFO_11531 [Tritrichomonas foetus]
MMESGFQDQIRQELRGRSAELNNLRSNGQSRKIFIVSKFWHDSLMDFIKEPAANAFDDKESASNIMNNNSTNPPFPGPIDNTSLCLSNGEFDTKKIYKKDFMIVEASIWSRLVEIFSCKSPVARRLSVHPITSCTVVLLDPIILERETSKETRIKTCSADWFVGDIRRPLCVVFRFVYADHTFVSYETNEVIPDTMTIGDYVKKFGNKIRLVEKAQVAEIQQIYSSSKNAKSKNSNNYSKSPFPHNYDTFTQANNISNNYSNNYSNNKSNYSNYSGNSSCSSSYNSTNSGYVSGNSSSNSSCLSSYNNKNLMKLKLTSTLQNLTFQIDEGSEIITVNPNSTKHSSSTYQIKHPNPVGLINNGNTCYFNVL